MANGKNVFNANNAYDTTPGAVNQNGEVKTIDRMAGGIVWHGIRGTCSAERCSFIVCVRSYLFCHYLLIYLFFDGTSRKLLADIHVAHVSRYIRHCTHTHTHACNLRLQDIRSVFCSYFKIFKKHRVE